MLTIGDLCKFLEQFAPSHLAESWDNVGLLAGDRSSRVLRVMTCLTITPTTVAEAVEREADLIVTHHPLPFRALKQLTTDTVEGRMLWTLVGEGVAIYSPHTAFDSAEAGINRRLAEGLGLTSLQVMQPRESAADDDVVGAGRVGRLSPAVELRKLADRVKKFLGVSHVQYVGEGSRSVSSVGVACGSAGDLLAAARAAGCDCFVTGELRFHQCLEIEAAGMTAIVAGHYATERFAVEQLAGVLAKQFAGLDVWASERERDPLVWG